MATYQEDLIKMACSREGCKHEGEQLEFRPACHETGGLKVLYRYASMDVVLLCGVCGKPVSILAVASRAGNDSSNIRVLPLVVPVEAKPARPAQKKQPPKRRRR